MSMKRVHAVIWLVIGLFPFVFGSVARVRAQSPKPRIAVFSGPNATIQHTEPFVTSNKARVKYGLPPITNPDGSAVRFDVVRPQRLAAPVTVYIEAFSAHPLESDAAQLYAPPDGYVNRQTRAFSKERQRPDDIPVYEATLSPDDGLYMLPYMARRTGGQPWDGDCATQTFSEEQCRNSFYPDGSRIFEEIDRFGLLGGRVQNNQLSAIADFDFYRAAPAGGYRNGLPAARRTDVGDGDIPREVWGEDFFPYGDKREEPARSTLARLTNIVQHAMGSGKYAGGIWLEGSSTTEETSYWLNLLIDTPVPISGNSTQTAHQGLGNDGDRNILSSTEYILSGIWKNADGKDRIGAVMIQEERVITAREVQKTDDRPGGYLPMGGHGGFVASTNPMVLTFVPVRKHTHTSEVNLTRLPRVVPGVQLSGNRLTAVQVPIKDAKGDLLPTAIPKVTIAKHAKYSPDDFSNDPAAEVEITARLDKDLKEFPLSGFVLEANTPYGNANEPLKQGLDRVALRGIPVVRVARGNAEGFVPPNSRDLTIEGNNLTATKARLLLMASLMKLGALPLPADPDHATRAELDAIRAKLAQYQEIFDTH
jgi:L-asparaginase